MGEKPTSRQECSIIIRKNVFNLQHHSCLGVTSSQQWLLRCWIKINKVLNQFWESCLCSLSCYEWLEHVVSWSLFACHDSVADFDNSFIETQTNRGAIASKNTVPLCQYFHPLKTSKMMWEDFVCACVCWFEDRFGPDQETEKHFEFPDAWSSDLSLNIETVQILICTSCSARLTMASSRGIWCLHAISWNAKLLLENHTCNVIYLLIKQSTELLHTGGAQDINISKGESFVYVLCKI